MRISSFASNRRLNRHFRLTLLASSIVAMAGCNWVELLSVSSTGAPANGPSLEAAISGDGRYVVFRSSATNLVAGDTNGAEDIFVHDTVMGSTTRVNVDSAGNQANNGNFLNSVLDISSDGRYVAFRSEANNLVAGDNSTGSDIFVHDRDTGTTTRVSVDSAGNEGNFLGSGTPVISGDGRYVAFSSQFPFVVEDTNSQDDIFVHDRNTGITSRVSVDSAGNQGTGGQGTDASDLSADGRYVTFSSALSNLVVGDTNGSTDIFMHDRATGATSRVNVSSTGAQTPNNASFGGAISDDGRYVAFISGSSNLAPGSSGGQQVYLRDLITGTTSRVSVDNAGNSGNDHSHTADISGDGRYISFSSRSSNLVAGDTNNVADIFVHDQSLGTTTRISLDALGAQASGGGFWGPASYFPSISADGRYVAFDTVANNLVADDTNGKRDIVIRALPQVTITSIIPDQLPIGATTSVTITGTSFFPGAFSYVGNTTLTNEVVVDEQTITVNVTVPISTPVGVDTVTVSLLGTGPGAFTGAAGVCNNCVTFF